MQRRGVILIEVIVACGLAAVLLTVCVQVLTLMAVERRGVERRAIGLQEAANLVEQASAIPFEQLTKEKLNAMSIDSALATLLPDGKAYFSVEEEWEPLPSKRVSVELSWLGAGRRREAPVRLTTWVFAPPKKVAVAEPDDGSATTPADTPATIPPARSTQRVGGPVLNLPAASEPAVIPPATADDSSPFLSSGGSP
jgi:hypothetical protein